MKSSSVKSSTSTRIVRTMGLFSGMKIIAMLCSLVRNKLIAWLIGPAGLGLITLFNSVVDLVAQSSRLSIDQTIQRDISQSGYEKYDVTLTVARRWALWLGIAGTAVMCMFSPVLSLWSFDTFSRWPVFCALSVVPFLLTYSSCVTAENQGLRRFKAVAYANIVASVLGLAIVIPLIIFFRMDSILWIVIAYGLTSWVGAMIFRPRFAKVQMAFKEFVSRGANFIRLGTQITIAVFVAQALNYFFVLYLNTFESTDCLGIFQSGYTMLNSYIGLIFTALWVEYYPRLSANSHSSRRLSLSASHEATVTLKILTPALILLIVFINPIIRLIYSDSFLEASPYIILGSTGTLFKLLSWSMAYVILAKGDGRTFLLTDITSSVIGLALNIAGYRLGGFTGLGLAYIIWYAIYTIVTVTVCHRKYGVKYSSRTWTLFALSLFAVGLTAVICLYRQ